MRDRILHFLTQENISSAKFADEIGVQRSSVSHILSGRNNPSFDFIQKILRRFELLNAEWLILGRGEMFKSQQQGIMFDTERRIEGKEETVNLENIAPNQNNVERVDHGVQPNRSCRRSQFSPD